MSFSYPLLSAEECEKERQFALLDPGIYNFQVMEANYKTSKTGNPMIELKLKVWDNAGKEFTVMDYLVGTKNMTWKTLHFCDAVSLANEYKSGTFNELFCIARSGKASVTIQPGNKKDDGTYYKDRNQIEDYVMTDQGAHKVQLNHKQNNEKPFDDDVPF
jgi:uncharacterized protein DUF669